MSEEYVVKQGDCLQSIATKHGFLWKSLWAHSDNAALKQKRKSGATLYVGDVVQIPDLCGKEESCATDTRHRFRKMCEKAELKLKLLKEKEESDELVESEAADFSEYIESPIVADAPVPDADAECSLYVDGKLVEKKKSGGDGGLTFKIPQDSDFAKLLIDEGKASERTIELNLGHMDPIDEPQGACKRLYNLGYQCPTDSNEYSELTGFAIQAFQKDHGLEATGDLDNTTKAKLEEIFGW